jgi:outer membrane protein assembly factor BamE
MFLRALSATAVLFLVSCGSARLPAPVVSPYRMEIQQGNFVSQEMLSQLKIGMTKDQVRFVMGTPLITDSFHADRWDYVFRRQKPSSSELEHHKFAAFFEGGKLVRMESDVKPAASADAAAVKTPAAKAEAPVPKQDTVASKPAPVVPKPEMVAPKLEAPALRQETFAPKLEAPAPKVETPAPKVEAPAPKVEASAPKVETPAPKAEAPAPKVDALVLRSEAPAAAPEAQIQPTSGALPEPKSGADNSKPGQVPAADQQPQEKKGLWDRIKDKVKF